MLAGLLLLAAACGESHDLEPDDFEELSDPALGDGGQPGSGLDGGGGLFAGGLPPGAIGGLFAGLGGTTAGGQPGGAMRDAAAPMPRRDAGAMTARDAGTSGGVCERNPQLPFCPRDAGVRDAGRDAGPTDAGTDAKVADAGPDAALDGGDAAADGAQ